MAMEGNESFTTHTHTHTHTYTPTHTHTGTHIQTHIHTHMQTHIHMHTLTHMHYTCPLPAIPYPTQGSRNSITARRWITLPLERLHSPFPKALDQINSFPRP